MHSSTIHRATCSPGTAWSTINAGEAIPGVVTPLTWSFFGDATERAMKQTFFDMGVLKRSQVIASARAEERLWDVFYGRAAANLNTFRWLGDRMPGTSGDAIEEQIFGQVRPGVHSERVLSRYPVIAARMPISAIRLMGRLERVTEPIKPWWQQQVVAGALADPHVARAALREAAARFEAVMRPHTMAAMLCQGMYEQLRALSERAGKPGLELSLVTGYGQMAETDVVADLWAVSRDRLALDEFIRRHGYHGPDEGELSARVWRMRREPLEALLRSYQVMGDDRDPRTIERERGVQRAEAEAELFAALPAPRRAAAQLITRLAARFIPLRGTGKAAFLQCVDVARAATWSLGETLTEQGSLGQPADAFMLTVAELLDPPPARSLDKLAGARREEHDRYRGLDVPDLFDGVPEPFAVERAPARAGGDGPITGTPVSPGIIDGVARVVTDPQIEEPLELGEVLVCRTTDPSWASTMMLAAALVIDIGGPISHGAIVARELGIPCVIGTRDGSSRIRTGDRVLVDGAKGEVIIMEQVKERQDMDNEDHELAVLRLLRLKGRAGVEQLTEASGLDSRQVTWLVSDLTERGGARELNGNYMLLGPGRERHDELLEQERGAIDAAAFTEVYESFTSVNHDFKLLASDWQLRGGQPNNHDDESYDQSVLDRLPAIHATVTPIVLEASAQAPRLGPYQQRFDAALQRVQAGDHGWLLKPLIDSYHTVWFEFHEELIGLAGLSRQAEAASGRAE